MPLFELTLWCWVVFGMVWLVSAFYTKRTVSDWPASRRVPYFLLLGAAFGTLFFAAMQPPRGPVVAGFVFTFAGLLLALWARAAIGRNWSGSIALKERHELVQRGPYAVVRHPIYSAILLMYLGTALAVGHAATLVGFAVVLASFVLKLQREEDLMRRTFPDAYPAYERRVKRLVPFIY